MTITDCSCSENEAQTTCPYSSRSASTPGVYRGWTRRRLCSDVSRSMWLNAATNPSAADLESNHVPFHVSRIECQAAARPSWKQQRSGSVLFTGCHQPPGNRSTKRQEQQLCAIGLRLSKQRRERLLTAGNRSEVFPFLLQAVTDPWQPQQAAKKAEAARNGPAADQAEAKLFLTADNNSKLTSCFLQAVTDSRQPQHPAERADAARDGPAADQAAAGKRRPGAGEGGPAGAHADRAGREDEEGHDERAAGERARWFCCLL